MGAQTIRVYRLAQELEITSREVLRLCQTLNLRITTASSSLSRSAADQVREIVLSQELSQDHRLSSPTSSEPSVSGLEVPESLLESRYYFNREISWLWFNERVLHEAFDPRTPLFEKLKFLAIFSSNLDEYFMVRVAGLKQQVEANVTMRSRDGLTPQQQLNEIRKELKPQVLRQHRYFYEELRDELASAGIHVLDYDHLNVQQTAYLLQYFRSQIFPVLTPLAVDPSHPFPYISNLSLNLAVVVKDSRSGDSHFARIKVPDQLPRFVQLPLNPGEDPASSWCGISMEQVISHHLDDLFPGMDIQGSYPFRITRNADIALEEDEADDLLIAIEEELRKRRFGSVVRLEIQNTMPDFLIHSLMSDLELEEADVYTINGYLRLNDLFALAAIDRPELKYQPWSPITHPRLTHLLPLNPTSNLSVTPIDPNKGRDELLDMFAVIRQKDLLVYHPYDSFNSSVQRFIEEAAYDPNVLTIKMTLYRTSGDSAIISPIIGALIAAAENGKQVVVLVELKARFDEENNILWARHLEQVGVHVVYGLVGLKTHTKISLVVRREGPNIRRYCHIGTGNYNPKTARLYTDLGLFTCRDDIGADLTDLFNYLTGFSRQQTYRKVLIAPHNLRDRILAHIHQEVEHQRQGKQGHIIAKMNSLVDSKMIASLYVASQAGVKVDLIVRGVCILKPGLKGISENIRVISIIGRYLEHDRIFYFHNCDQPHVFIGSADWRPRNLDRRVEAVVPIEDPSLIQDLKSLLDLFLQDNRQAWELQPDGDYIQRKPLPNQAECASHVELMNIARLRSQPQ